MNYRPFSPDDDAKLTALWTACAQSVESIALDLDRGATSIRKRAAILGLPPRVTDTAWTADRKALCVKLWQEGKSAREIANTLKGVSRNAVIGILHRMGMSQRPAPARLIRLSKAARPAKARVARPPRPAAPPKERRLRIATAAPRLTPIAPVLVDATHARPWMERTFGECAYPISGEGADTLSCCAPCGDRGYCKAHRRIMFVKPKHPVEKLANWAARVAA